MLQYIRFPTRIKENGQERVEIEEDGVLKSVLINGKTAHWRHQDNQTFRFLIAFCLKCLIQ